MCCDGGGLESDPAVPALGTLTPSTSHLLQVGTPQLGGQVLVVEIGSGVPGWGGGGMDTEHMPQPTLVSHLKLGSEDGSVMQLTKLLLVTLWSLSGHRHVRNPTVPLPIQHPANVLERQWVMAQVPGALPPT